MVQGHCNDYSDCDNMFLSFVYNVKAFIPFCYFFFVKSWLIV
jgi:hypothetical protein